jgi:hypothetical protein
MVNSYNLQNYTPVSRPARKNEVINWQAYQHNNGNNAIVFFESVPEILKMMDKYWETTEPYRNQRSQRDEWLYGEYKTWGRTRHALETEQKYLERVDETKHELFRRFPELQNLQHDGVAKRRRRRYAEDGDELDIDRYMSNDVNMWASMPPQDVQKKVARVYVNVWGSVGTQFNTFIDNVVIAVALIDIMESAGIAVEVLFGNTADNIFRNVYSDSTICWVAKHAGDKVDISKMITYGLSGLLRAVMFDNYEALGILGGSTGGKGTLISKPLEDCQTVKDLNADIVIKGDDGYTRTGKLSMYIGKVRQLFNLPEHV